MRLIRIQRIGDSCKEKPEKRRRIARKERIPTFKKLVLLFRRLEAQIRRITLRVNNLQEQVDSLTAPRRSLVNQLRGRLNTRITIQTQAGSVFGTIIFIGTDFVQIQEPNGSIVLIPLSRVLSFA